MIIVGDNIQITNPVIARAVEKEDPEPVCRMAIECERAGADMLDINSGPLYKNPEEKMRFLVKGRTFINISKKSKATAIRKTPR